MSYLYQYHDGPQILHNQKIGFAPHLHRETEIVVLFQGTAVLHQDGRRDTMKPGDFAFIFPDCVHGYASDGPVDVGKFIFSTRAFPEVDALLTANRPVCPVVSAPELADFAMQAIDGCQTGTPLERQGWLALLTARLLRRCPLVPRSAGPDSTLTRVLDYCQTHFRQELTLQAVAEALYLSESHLSHLFSAKIRMPFRDYVNLLRVGEAEDLLRRTGLSVTEIAARCGFGSIRSLNRAFLRHRGRTPREIRQAADTVSPAP